jgi:hypothetical protein
MLIYLYNSRFIKIFILCYQLVVPIEQLLSRYTFIIHVWEIGFPGIITLLFSNISRESHHVPLSPKEPRMWAALIDITLLGLDYARTDLAIDTTMRNSQSYRIGRIKITVQLLFPTLHVSRFHVAEYGQRQQHCRIEQDGHRQWSRRCFVTPQARGWCRDNGIGA